MEFVDYAHQIFAENTTTSLVAITGMSKQDIHEIRQELKLDESANDAAKKVGSVLTRDMLETLAFSPADINAYIRARNAAGVKLGQVNESHGFKVGDIIRLKKDTKFSQSAIDHGREANQTAKIRAIDFPIGSDRPVIGSIQTDRDLMGSKYWHADDVEHHKE